MENIKQSTDSRCLQAELSILGSAMIDDKIIPRLTSYVSPEKFFHQSLGTIFKVICDLYDAKSPVDVVSVSNGLRKVGAFESVGGENILRSVIEAVPFADHGEHYAKIAADYYYEREIIKSCVKLSESPTSENLNDLTKIVLAREHLGLPNTFDYKNDLYDILDNLIKKKKGRLHEVGFPTFDKAFKGLLPGEVITWGAATNMGKSLLLTNVMSHCAQRGEPVLYVGTEMSAEETVVRHLSILTGIEPYKIKLSTYSSEELSRLQACLSDRMFPMPVRILDLPEPSLSDVEAELTAYPRQVVFLDYLERFRMPRGENRRLQVNDFMRRVKNMARKYDVVVHLASQLSREVYGAEERRPTLAHLSESSSIEKESDRVLLVWAPKEKNPDADKAPGYRILEVVVAKDRHGRRGLAVDLKLDEKNLRIAEIIPDSSPTEEFV